jgi:hypothetical protein
MRLCRRRQAEKLGKSSQTDETSSSRAARSEQDRQVTVLESAGVTSSGRGWPAAKTASKQKKMPHY